MLEKSKNCCFAGYRPEKIRGLGLSSLSPPEKISYLLQNSIISAYKSGYTTFISGMSRGFDIWAAKTVIELRKEIPIKLFCALPFLEQSKYWENDIKKQYNDILLRSDFVYLVSEYYEKGCYYKRNEFMVLGSSRLICWFDGKSGGTEHTFKLAKKNGLEIDNLYEGQIRMY